MNEGDGDGDDTHQKMSGEEANNSRQFTLFQQEASKIFCGECTLFVDF